MHLIDWLVILVYTVITLGLGFLLTRKASKGIESYFASDRKLAWWLAGTSMAATAFSSDTPLLVTGIVRRKGIWGNWEIWALAISTMFSVFFFSRLWKRAGVLTEVELVELRYSGKPAAFLRGFKAIYWGMIYNAFIMGAWPMTGLVKVMQETTDWSKVTSIIFCMAITMIYCHFSGYWGVVVTDFFQYITAMAGAILLAFYAVHAAGGMQAMLHQLSPEKLMIIPPASGHAPLEYLQSPFGWFLALLTIQWWAWKNTDGGGILVQRIASCKNERHAVLATLWFNIAQYALRSWPWIITALASLVLIPDLADHERAYPRLIAMLLPTGLKGMMIASFFAAFMSTMSTHLNWGASYFVNDFYKRFIRPEASEKHLVTVARLAQIFLACAAMGVAFFTSSISGVFTFVLNLSAAIGPVYLLRWFWWRTNAWSEVLALASSLPVILLRPHFFHALGVPENLAFDLLFMILGSAAVWLPVTLMTAPAPDDQLRLFYAKVRPPGFWSRFAQETEAASEWTEALKVWGISTAAILLVTIGPLKLLLGQILSGALLTGSAVILWIYVGTKLQEKK
ncbi:MAG TPA: sodium:solute symporter family protein [Verrucomicrobiae bacterium]|nr:sodium:solute symporter family protein [Verrucomicrobiae bacterium]